MTLSIPTATFIILRRVLLSAAIVCSAGIWLWNDYHHTLESSAIQQTNVARLLETHTLHVIANVDSILDRVRDEVRDHDILGKGGDRRWPIFAEMAKRLPVSGRLWLYRADGSAVMASHLRHSTNNATDREYFMAQLQRDAGLFIGETVVGKTTGNKVFNLSRRIEAPDGSFAGVAMAAIDIDVFIQVVSELNLGKTAAYTLARSDGAIIMRYPDAGATGRRFNLAVLDDVTKESSGVISVVSQIDGMNRQVAFRKHATLPLIFVVTLTRDEILAPWRQRAAALGGGLAVLFLVAGVLIGIANKAARREQSAVARMQTVLDTVAEGICGLDAQGRFVFINPAGARLLGYRQDELVGKELHAIAHHSLPDGSAHPVENCPIHGLLNHEGETHGTDYFWNKEGKGFATEFAATRVADLDGQQGVVLAFRDVSAVIAARDALRANEEYFRMLAENMVDIVWKADREMRFTYVNYADRRLRGFDREEVIGRPIMETLTPEGKAILQDVMARRNQLEASGHKGQPLRFDLPQCCKDGSEVWVEFMSLPTYDADGQISGYQGIGRDVSARKREDAQRIEEQHLLEIRLAEAAAQQMNLQEQVNRDPLTGINNRRYLNETLPRELSRARREGDPVAVIMIDLDHFKQINDTYGHAAGDEVLKSLAALLKRGARESDVICRYGGEEFVVIMPGMDVERARQRIESWRTELAELRVQHREADIRVTLSAGLVGFPEHGNDMTTLLARADEMLYRSKSGGRNQVSVCS